MAVALKKLDGLDNMVIVSDFDGTITDIDTNDLIYFDFGGEESRKVEKLIIQGKMGVKEGALNHFQRIHLTEERFINHIFQHARIDEGFKEFCRVVKEKGIPFVVVSGGYINTIKAFFKKEGIDDSNIEIYANRLNFTGCRIEIDFIDEDDECETGLGPCGNCKLKRLRELGRKYRNIIFIGDGVTDRCAVGEADVVFAKGALKEYCTLQGIPYIEFSSFHDILDYLLQKL
ncbi:MAG: MtnX-like HAD-IB family phosphatase [Clostridiales bacterium]|nr:MtnX-like HAD-IB family phosphatase [Clostridiales bacterium]